MAWTKLSLRTQTRMFLDEVSPVEWTDAMIDTEINNAYQAMITSIIAVYEDYYSTTALVNTIALQQEYGVSDGLPADIFKIRRIEVNYKPSVANNQPTRALPANIDSVKSALGNANSINAVRATTLYYHLGFGANKKIGFVPIPQEAGVGAIKIWYIPLVGNMTSDSDVPNIPYPDRYGYLITKFAAANCLRKGQMEEAVAARYLQEFGGGILQMQEELNSQVAEESKTVIDAVGDSIDFSLP